MWVLGSNGSYQLSTGHDRDVAVAERVVLPDELAREELDGRCAQWCVASGGNHTLLLSHGQVYLSGTLDKVCKIFERRWPERRWTDVSCGFGFAVLVDEAGCVFAVGECGRGSLSSIPRSADLIQITLPRPAVSVTCGVSHVVALLDNGECWTWGGERAQKTSFSPSAPRRIGHDVLRTVAGNGWTVMIKADGTRELHGKAKFSQDNVDKLPHADDYGTNWASLHALSQGKIHSVGRRHAPAQLPLIKTFRCGSEHIVFLAEEQDAAGLKRTASTGAPSEQPRQTRRVLAFGWNEHGNCGVNVLDRGGATASEQDIHIPLELDVADSQPIRGIAAGYATTFIW